VAVPVSARLGATLAAGFALAQLAPVARADDPSGGYFSGTPVECPGLPSAEAAVVTCNSQALARADRELNALYRDLIARADPAERQALQDAQLGWIRMRDGQCALVKAYHRTAPFPEKWTSRCQAVMTIRRVQELKALGTGIGW
jgi:uncharacterized protein YecT (DUF1311 family)